jgi:hypothetical protein
MVAVLVGFMGADRTTVGISGLPTRDNTHELAQRVAPDPRIV